MILDDIRRELAKARAERASKHIIDLGQRGRFVILVGQRAAYAAARVNEADRGLSADDLATFEGCEVYFGGCIGVAVEWRV